jgi:hypothetical protein
MKKQNAETRRCKDAKFDTEQQAWEQRSAQAQPWSNRKKSLCVLAPSGLGVLLFSIG